MALEELIKAKRSKAAEKLKSAHPELVQGIDIEQWGSNLPFRNAYKICPVESREFLAWDDILYHYYWRSFNHVEQLEKQGFKNPLTAEDKKILTELMIEQIAKGEHVAIGIPIYSDVWGLVGKKGSPLESYVTDEHKRKAVNEGFWSAFNYTENSRNPTSGGRELTRIIDYEDFYKYFDFKEGAKRALALPENLNLTEFDSWNHYMRWYLVQEIALVHNLPKDKINDTRGKLLAPLVKYLIGTSDAAQNVSLRKLANFFIQGEMISSKPMQNMLGEVFEYELSRAFDNPNYFDAIRFEICAKNLLERNKHAAKVWKEVQGNVDLSRLEKDVANYVTKEAYDAHLQKLKLSMQEMQRFDAKLFREWANLDLRKYNISKAAHGKIRNQAIEVYFKQKTRPSGDDVLSLVYCASGGSNYMPEKIKGFAFADLLRRKKWSDANDLLLKYQNLTLALMNHFYQGISDHYKMHGSLYMNEEALETTACYPKYNAIIDFHKRFPQAFKKKQPNPEKSETTKTTS